MLFYWASAVIKTLIGFIDKKGFMMQIDEQIFDFLTQHGVSTFWANSAVKEMRNVFCGNTYFTKNYSNPVVTVGDLGYVSRFEMLCDVIFPDVDKEQKGTIVYTFTPHTKAAHKACIQLTGRRKKLQ